MNIDNKLHIGFITRTSDENNKPHFTFSEHCITRVYKGKTKTTIKLDGLAPTFDVKTLQENMELLRTTPVILVDEPFVTYDEYSKHCIEWCAKSNADGAAISE